MNKTQANMTLAVAAGLCYIGSFKQSSNASKLMIEFVEGMAPGADGQPINIAAIGNEADDRFKATVRVRRHWQGWEIANLDKIIGLDVKKVIADLKAAKGEPIFVEIKSPKLDIGGGKTVDFAIQQVDSVTPFDQYQANDLKGTAKQFEHSKRGILHFFKENQDGTLSPIYSRKKLVAAQDRNDRIIQSNVISKWEDEEYRIKLPTFGKAEDKVAFREEPVAGKK